MYRQSIPRIGLSIEKGTKSVPADDMFHVLLNGQEVFKSHSEKEALVSYRTLKHSLTEEEAPRTHQMNLQEALRREMNERQATEFLAESSRAKRTRALRKGGPGGSGGVAG